MEENFDAPSVERAAAAVLDRALARSSALHLPGMRDQHRAEVGRAIELASSALTVADAGRTEAVAGALSTLVKAHAARARDARHGAGQLSLGAQRAPTRDDCDDGWRRVEEIVGVAEASAVEAARLALLLDDPAARSAARAAESGGKGRAADRRRAKSCLHVPCGSWVLVRRGVVPRGRGRPRGRRDPDRASQTADVPGREVPA